MIAARVGNVDVQVLLDEHLVKFPGASRPKPFGPGWLMLTKLETQRRRQWMLRPDEFRDAGYEITPEIEEILKVADELFEDR